MATNGALMNTPAPASTRRAVAARRRPTVADRRVGYAVSLLINLAGLWIVNHLLAWGWPPFLTPAFEDLLPYLDASFVASVLVNLVWVVRDPAWSRHVGQIGLDLVALVVVVRTWQIYPFDLSGYDPVWDTLIRTVMGFSLFGLIVATIVELVRLAVLCRGGDGPGPRRGSDDGPVARSAPDR